MFDFLLKIPPARRWTILALWVASIGGIKLAGMIIGSMGIPRILEMALMLPAMVGIPFSILVYAAQPVEDRISHLFYYKKQN